MKKDIENSVIDGISSVLENNDHTFLKDPEVEAKLLLLCKLADRVVEEQCVTRVDIQLYPHTRHNGIKLSMPDLVIRDVKTDAFFDLIRSADWLSFSAENDETVMFFGVNDLWVM